MKTIYTRPICPACLALKAKLTREGVPFQAIVVRNEEEPSQPGRSMSRSAFVTLFPDVKSFPFVVESENDPAE